MLKKKSVNIFNIIFIDQLYPLIISYMWGTYLQYSLLLLLFIPLLSLSITPLHQHHPPPWIHNFWVCWLTFSLTWAICVSIGTGKLTKFHSV